MKKYFIVFTFIIVSMLSGCFNDRPQEIKPIETVVKPRTINVDTQTPDFENIDKNQDFILSFKINNPKKLDIISVVINNELYSNFQFEEGSNYELVNVKLNSGDTPGLKTFTLSSVKAIEGNDIVDLSATSNNSIELFVNYTVPSVKSITLDKQYYHKEDEAQVTIEFDNPDNQELQFIRINGLVYETFHEGYTNSKVQLTYTFDGTSGNKTISVTHGIFNDEVIEFTENNTIETYVLKAVPEVSDINIADTTTPVELNSTILLKIDFVNDDEATITSIKLNDQTYTSDQFKTGSTHNQLFVEYKLNNNPIQTIKLKEISFNNGKEDYTYVLSNNLSIYINEVAMDDPDIIE